MATFASSLKRQAYPVNASTVRRAIIAAALGAREHRHGAAQGLPWRIGPRLSRAEVHDLKNASTDVRQVARIIVTVAALWLCGAAFAAERSRQDDVRAKGADVMPFALDQTVHVFDKNDAGGVQRVLARGGADAQKRMIRGHLREIAESFAARDFSKPAHIHGADMPGLAEMKAASAQELEVIYSELPDGAQIIYRSASPRIVAAIHRWFDAQLRDHGKDATTSEPGAAHPPP